MRIYIVYDPLNIFLLFYFKKIWKIQTYTLYTYDSSLIHDEQIMRNENDMQYLVSRWFLGWMQSVKKEHKK